MQTSVMRHVPWHALARIACMCERPDNLLWTNRQLFENIGENEYAYARWVLENFRSDPFGMLLRSRRFASFSLHQKLQVCRLLSRCEDPGGGAQDAFVRMSVLAGNFDLVKGLCLERLVHNMRLIDDFLLCWSADVGDADFVQHLLCNEEHQRVRSPENVRSAVHVAAVKGHEHVLRNLLDHAGGDVASYHDDLEMLRAVCVRGDLDVLALLAVSGVPISHAAGSMLQPACVNGHIQVVDWLLSTHGGTLDEPSIRRSLASCVESGNWQVSTLLLRHPLCDKRFALSTACRHGDVHLTSYILSNENVGVDEAAFLQSVRGGHVRIVQMLLGKWDMPSAVLNQALCESSKSGHLDIMRDLLCLGQVDVHVHDDLPLKRAVWHGHMHGVQLLLSKGALASRLSCGQRAKLVFHHHMQNGVYDFTGVTVDSVLNDLPLTRRCKQAILRNRKMRNKPYDSSTVLRETYMYILGRLLRRPSNAVINRATPACALHSMLNFVLVALK